MLGLSILLSLLVGQTWSKAYDRSACNDSSFSIVYDEHDDAYVVVGHTSNGPLGGTDVLVVKLNAPDGNIIWSKAYGCRPGGEASNDYGRSIIKDFGDTNFYVVAGYSDCFQLPPPNKDVLVFKILSSNGNMVWGNRYAGFYVAGQPTPLNDFAYSIVKDGGDYIIAGNVEPGPAGGLSDAMVMAVNKGSGAPVWSWAYGKVFMGGTVFGNEYLYSIIEDSSKLPCSLFVTTGKTIINEIQTTDILVFKGKKVDGTIDPVTQYMFDYIPPIGPGHSACGYNIKNDHPGYIITGDLDTGIIVMKLQPNLFVGWGNKCRTYNLAVHATSRCIELTSDGNYVLVGTTKPGIPGPSDVLITKINLQGNVLWSKVLTGCNPNTWMNQDDNGQYIVEGPAGFYAATGYTNWTPNSGTTNLLVARTDQNGFIPCPPLDTCLKNLALLVDSPGVYKDSSMHDYLIMMNPFPMVDTVVELVDTTVCCSQVGTEEGCSCNRDVGIYNSPNPYANRTYIYYNLRAESNVRIAIYNLSGQLIRTLADGRMAKGNHSVMWDGRNENGIKLSPGVYFYAVKIGKNTVTKKMTMIR